MTMAPRAPAASLCSGSGRRRRTTSYSCNFMTSLRSRYRGDEAHHAVVVADPGERHVDGAPVGARDRNDLVELGAVLGDARLHGLGRVEDDLPAELRGVAAVEPQRF